MMFIILSLSSFSNHVPPIFCLSLCLIYLSIWHKSTKNKTKNPHRVSAIFHFSLFTFHFSLKETVTHILHSSFFILHLRTASARFFTFHSSLFTLHFSLFTFHFSLKATVTPILHSSFFIKKNHLKQTILPIPPL